VSWPLQPQMHSIRAPAGVRAWLASSPARWSPWPEAACQYGHIAEVGMHLANGKLAPQPQPHCIRGFVWCPRIPSSSSLVGPTSSKPAVRFEHLRLSSPRYTIVGRASLLSSGGVLESESAAITVTAITRQPAVSRRISHPIMEDCFHGAHSLRCRETSP